jgi:hypothetical protein
MPERDAQTVLSSKEGGGIMNATKQGVETMETKWTQEEIDELETMRGWESGARLNRSGLAMKARGAGGFSSSAGTIATHRGFTDHLSYCLRDDFKPTATPATRQMTRDEMLHFVTHGVGLVVRRDGGKAVLAHCLWLTSAPNNYEWAESSETGDYEWHKFTHTEEN